MKTSMKLSPSLEKSTRRASVLHPLRVLVTVLLVAVAAVLVWVMPLRPTHSDFEQRELAKFPAFSWEALASGTYFDDISLWFSDTFPARETFVELSGKVRGTFGIQTETIHGTVTEGDDIPDAPTRPPVISTTTTVTVTTTVTESVTTTTTVPPTTATDAQAGTTTTVAPIDPDILNQNQSLGAILVKGDTAYEYYNFVRSAADKYVAAINRAGTVCGDATVYSMIVPTSIDVKLPDAEHPKNSSDQGKAIAYMYGSLAENIRTVNVRDTLLAHRDEYLYFHTDHHWTSLGAYYAVSEFAAMQGKTAAPLSAYEEKHFTGFLGSFYSQTQNAGLKLGGDTVVTYKPLGNVSMVRGSSAANAKGYPIITDVTNWAARSKYSTFIGGDNGYSCITNADITDNSAVVLIKDSYGNAFAPFLSTMYHKVYILDFRHFNGTLAGFVKENKVDDVLFLNNISATRNATLINKFDAFIGK